MGRLTFCSPHINHLKNVNARNAKEHMLSIPDEANDVKLLNTKFCVLLPAARDYYVIALL